VRPPRFPLGMRRINMAKDTTTSRLQPASSRLMASATHTGASARKRKRRSSSFTLPRRPLITGDPLVTDGLAQGRPVILFNNAGGRQFERRDAQPPSMRWAITSLHSSMPGIASGRCTRFLHRRLRCAELRACPFPSRKAPRSLPGPDRVTANLGRIRVFSELPPILCLVREVFLFLSFFSPSRSQSGLAGEGICWLAWRHQREGARSPSIDS